MIKNLVSESESGFYRTSFKHKNHVYNLVYYKNLYLDNYITCIYLIYDVTDEQSVEFIRKRMKHIEEKSKGFKYKLLIIIFGKESQNL